MKKSVENMILIIMFLQWCDIMLLLRIIAGFTFGNALHQELEITKVTLSYLSLYLEREK